MQKYYLNFNLPKKNTKSTAKDFAISNILRIFVPYLRKQFITQCLFGLFLSFWAHSHFLCLV
jgi:hypothetical protein